MLAMARRRLIQPYNAQRGVFYEGLVATRAGNTETATGNTQMMSRSGHKAVVDISWLKVAITNFRVSTSDATETGNGASATITASIEYPTGVFSQITFQGGNPTGNIPTAGMIISDRAQPAQMIPRGATFWIRQWFVSAGFSYQPYRSAFGDQIQYSGGPTDKTMGGTITDSGSFSFLPAAIIGMTDQPSVIAIGDSITAGFNDTAGISDYRRGIVCKGFPADTLAFLNHGMSSARAADYVTNAPNRVLLWKYGSHFITDLGNNDIFITGSSAAATLALIQNNIWSKFPPRARITQGTITPRSSTTDAYATAANQTTNAANGVKNTFNNLIRAGGISGLNNGFNEYAWAVENAHDDGKWAVDGTASKYTADGVHATGAGYILGSAATDMTKIF